MLRIVLLIIFFYLQSSTFNLVQAQDKANADAAYRMGDYKKAVELYQKAQKKGVSAELYYNMGNAYYRMADYPSAMASYLKAQKLSPGNKDIQHNIEITTNKTIDRIPVDGDVLFVQWYKSLVFCLTINAWTWLSLVAVALALLFFLAYLFMQSMLVRKISFYISVVLACIFFVSAAFAFHQRSILLSKDKGVVAEEMVTVKSSPTQKASDSFVIHEGTVVDITDSDIPQWLSIKLSDGRQGWIPSKAIELI